MKIDTTKLIRISTYARRAEKSVQTIYYDIKVGKLEKVDIDGMTFVYVPDNKDKR